MKEIYSDRDSVRVGHAKSLLEAAGISCFVRNEASGALIGASIAGVLPMFYPVLCVAFDEDYTQARGILKAWLDEQKANPDNQPESPDWICPHCGETVPAGFDECWSCQTLRASP